MVSWLMFSLTTLYPGHDLRWKRMNLVGSVFFFMMQAILWAFLLLDCWLDLFYVAVHLIFFSCQYTPDSVDSWFSF